MPLVRERKSERNETARIKEKDKNEEVERERERENRREIEMYNKVSRRVRRVELCGVVWCGGEFRARRCLQARTVHGTDERVREEESDRTSEETGEEGERR